MHAFTVLVPFVPDPPVLPLDGQSVAVELENGYPVAYTIRSVTGAIISRGALRPDTSASAVL